MVTMLLIAVAFTATPATALEDWTRFRGPNGSGLSDTKGLPVEFGPALNVVWKAELPQGYSSPVIAGERIFLTGFRNDKLLTLSVDRKTGKVIWEREAPRDRTEKLDPRNHPASASAATDGQSVFVFFGDYGLLAYDVSGKELWRKPLGPFNNIYGMGASPIVADDKVVLACDQSTGSFIAAFDKKTGNERWRTARPEAKSGHSTPIVYRPAHGGTQILLPGSFLLTAYAAESGARVWWVGGLAFEMKSVPVIDGDTLYINGFGSGENEPGRRVTVAPSSEVFAAQDANKDGKLSAAELPNKHAQEAMAFVDLDGDKQLSVQEWDYYKAAMDSENGMLAIRLGGKGDMTEKSVRWTYRRAVPQLPSPVVYQSVLYMVNDGGIVTSLKPDTGELIMQGRLKGAIDRYYASPVAGDGKIYMASEKGKVAVLKPDGGLDPIAVNDMQEDIYATPALLDGRIYLRTRTTLYCLG
ncbi:MAG: PQQ-binding-like beta-propeller repeat protein, partial [Acidobacteria bacterium]|nr:PQQ-binding-like beta-propeller repeat protein [Acidobacteriota bacterium]